ncbi:MAG: helix-turn-helix domain-containing protein [Minisyncoccia bacterium]
MTLEDTLASLGLSRKETQVYVSMLKTGMTSAASIAKEASLPRQTTYSLLEELIAQGFIEQSDKKGVRQYYADPNELGKLIARRKDELDRAKKVLDETVPKLLAEHRRGTSFPVVQYYEGQVGLTRLFENILDQHKNSKTKIFRGFGINRFYGGMESYIREFLKRRHKLGVTTRLLIADAPNTFGIKGPETSLGRDVKHLPIDEQEAGIYLVGKNAYFFSYKDNVGVMIENQAITEYLKQAFDLLWEKA